MSLAEGWGGAQGERAAGVRMEVLLVEDEAPLRETLAEGLAEAGLDVAEAPSAEVALWVAAAALAGRPPRVLVADVNLGRGMDGLALAAEARRRWPVVGVVVMTGMRANLEGRCPGPREVCPPKPFGALRLASAVVGLMRRSGRRGKVLLLERAAPERRRSAENIRAAPERGDAAKLAAGEASQAARYAHASARKRGPPPHAPRHPRRTRSGVGEA